MYNKIDFKEINREDAIMVNTTAVIDSKKKYYRRKNVISCNVHDIKFPCKSVEFAKRLVRLMNKKIKMYYEGKV